MTDASDPARIGSAIGDRGGDLEIHEQSEAQAVREMRSLSNGTE